MTNIYIEHQPIKKYDLTPIYYVYMYLREENSSNGCKHSPYYIGKGKESRAFNHGKGEVHPTKNNSNIRFIIENISEEEAYMWEEFWIDFFGRIDLETGCLHNKSNGGDGNSGYTHPSKGKTRTEYYGEERNNEINEKRIKRGPGHHNYGKTLSYAGKAWGDAIRGKTWEEIFGEEKAKEMRDKKKGQPSPNLGKIYGPKSNNAKNNQLAGMNAIADEQCKHCGAWLKPWHIKRFHNENCKSP